MMDSKKYNKKEVLQELDKAHQDIARLVNFAGRQRKALADMVAGLGDSGESRRLKEILQKFPVLTSQFNEGNAVAFYTRDRDFTKANIWADATSDRTRDSLSNMKALRVLRTKEGSISDALELSYRIAKKEKSQNTAGLQFLEGRVKELHGAVPKIQGPIRRIDNLVEGRIVHLVKESRPNLSNGFTSRSHKNFLAEKASGLEPVVITEPGFPDNNPKTRTEFVDGILHVRLGMGSIDYSKVPADQFNQMFADLAYEEIKKLRPQVIHASSGRRGFETALSGIALRAKTGIPLVYEVRSFFEANWTDDTRVEQSGEIFTQRMATEEYCMAVADRVLTICESMKDELVSRGVPPKKIGIIPNAVDSEHFKPVDRNIELARKYGLLNVPTFGYVSNMDHYRESQETLIEALAILGSRGRVAKCILVGGGPRMDLLKELATERGVSDRVIFTGSVDHNEIDEYYSLIDLFVVPRIRERAATYVTPLKPFEAMAQRKPVVTSDLPALLEITDAPKRGLSYTAGDAESLADRLETLFEDREAQERIAQAGYEWVISERTWKSNGDRYVQEFSKLGS
ncbi:glycosyltransferase family 4 protein [Glutamicibacter sp. NPDC127525]|uniref:glycosyltransferase family 4 protein n=1 Tax=unclassified Glutamicibacter TaxID=2627139 RepID=UPI0036331079